MFPKIVNRRRGPALGLAASFGIAQAVAAGVAAFATRDIFAAIHRGGTLPADAILTLLGCGIAIALLRIAERTLAEWIGQHYSAQLRSRIFRHLMDLPPRVLSRRSTGGLSLRFVGDLTAIRTWISRGVVRLISAICVLPGALFVLWLLNPIFALTGGAILAVSMLLMALMQFALAPRHRRVRSLRAKIAIDMSERAPIAAELRLQGRKRTELRRLRELSLRMRRAAVDRIAAASFLKAVPDVALAVAGVAFLALAFTMSLSAAEVAASLALLGIVAAPMRQLASVWDFYRAWEIAREKCQALFQLSALNTGEQDLIPGEEAGGEKPDQSPEEPAGEGGLHIDNVTHYNLASVCARVAPGRKIAITGGNGQGKSTLLMLIAGLDNPLHGRITLDGKPILPKQICYIGARSPLLRGSLRRAFTLGVRKRPTDEEILSAATAFGLGPLLARLGGLEGRIAEAGRNLSSGEVRRILLVRATLSEAPILLLDEPDDALDHEGRLLVANLIAQTDSTVLFVSHDPGLTRKAEQIWHIDNGECRILPPYVDVQPEEAEQQA